MSDSRDWSRDGESDNVSARAGADFLPWRHGSRSFPNQIEAARFPSHRAMRFLPLLPHP